MFKYECKFLIAVLCTALLSSNAIAQVKTSWQMQPVAIQTRWAKEVNPENVWKEYPRPQMVRSNWENLNGLWDYAVTRRDVSSPVKFEGKILVPYPLESALSGVKKMLLPDQLLWYRRSILKPVVKQGEKVLLHFDAVDYDATVYLNGTTIGHHTGGYQNFSIDITKTLKEGNNELKVKVWDPSDTGPNPHGKQVLNPGGIMYTPSSGIWQTVWLETVPGTYLESFRITPDIDAKQLLLNATIASDAGNYTIEAVAKINDIVVGTAKGNGNNDIAISITSPHLWSPDDPFLYDLIITVKKNGKTVDEVKSYFGMRKIEIKKDNGVDRIFLNNKYVYNLGTLDQGFWPDGLYTAPTDAALRFDIEAAKAMGFNTIRKHIKIEPARWYYYTDKLGMLVWQDMVNPGNDSPEARTEFEKESKENIWQLYNYPSIITWVLFNEGWGAYDQTRLARWMKDTDPTRILNGHSGSTIVGGKVTDPKPIFEKSINSDLTDVHSYPPPAIPAHMDGKAMVVGEFGGIAVSVENHLWDDVTTGFGYGNVVMPPEMLKNYSCMMDSLKLYEQQGLSGSIYTQPFDVEAEQNGLITYDRQIIKLSEADIRKENSKIWPTTANYILATKGFSARIADTITQPYASRLKQYQEGKTDSLFLRNLAILADGRKDKGNAERVAATYLNSIKDPLKVENLKFIQKFTKSTKDKGFALFLSNREKIDDILGKDAVEEFIRRLIDAEIRPVVFNDSIKPDLSKLEHEVVTKYGREGEQVIWILKALYYYYDKDYDNFVTMKVKIHNRYPGAISIFDMNNDAWLVFKNVSDQQQLEAALSWSKQVIEKEPTANYYDTYANLLYKLGRKEEAIHTQEKGLTLDPGNGSIDDVKKSLEKMKKGEPTWSVPASEGN